MKYSDTYIVNHDIDWFCVVNGVYIHVASAGGIIPDVVNDVRRLRTIQHLVALLPYICDEDGIEYNEQAITNMVDLNDAEARAQYIESFKEMACKGFVSIDKTNIEDGADNHYHIVCRPNNHVLKPDGIDIPMVNTELSLEEWIVSETVFKNLPKNEEL